MTLKIECYLERENCKTKKCRSLNLSLIDLLHNYAIGLMQILFVDDPPQLIAVRSFQQHNIARLGNLKQPLFKII